MAATEEFSAVDAPDAAAPDDGLLAALDAVERGVWRLRDRLTGYDLVRRSHQRVIEDLSRSLARAQKKLAEGA